MTEHGWEQDDWPTIYEQVTRAHILVITTPIWLGEKFSVSTKVIERLYANSHLLNDYGQYAYYGKVGDCLITGNEDGTKHCAMNISVLPAAPGLHDSAAGRRRLAGRGGAGVVLSGPWVRRAPEQFYESKCHVHDLEPAACGPDADRRRRYPRAREPAIRMGCRLSLRSFESDLQIGDSHASKSWRQCFVG